MVSPTLTARWTRTNGAANSGDSCAIAAVASTRATSVSPSLGRRRVAGLRREEVAALAGVGLTWYTMLENGSAEHVSEATLAAVARALRLDAGEIAYLGRMAEARASEPPSARLDETTRGALEAIAWAPAYVCTSHWVVLAWNAAMALVWGFESPGGAPFNIVSRMFADPSLRAMHGDRFDAFARGLVAMVRAATASHLEDAAYRRMCDELLADPTFASAWHAYDVVQPTGSTATTVDSAAVGVFSYRTITLEIPGDDGHWLVVQVPDVPSAARLRTVLDGSGDSPSGR